MKKLTLIAAAPVAMMASAASAASDDSVTFDINASVLPECSMENPGTVNLGPLSIDEDPGAGALLLDNPSPSAPQSMYISCNTAAIFYVDAQNRALVNSGTVTDTAQFTNRINYDIRLSPDRTSAFAGLGSYKPRVQANGAGNARTANAEFHANYDLVIGFEAPNVNNLRPIAGDYTETVTFTVAAI